MNVLVACEYSGTVRDAFIRAGHTAISVDLMPSESDAGPHHQGDVLAFLDDHAHEFDLMIAHPPCTYLALSGIHWNNRIPGRAQQTRDALAFVQALMDAPIPRIAIENPVGVISTHIRKPDQYINPWQYGHPEAKKTGLWLTNLPNLEPTNILTPTTYQDNGKPRWDNQTPTGQNKLAPSADRWKLRSLFYRGWADAMADQWGSLADCDTVR